MTSSTTIRLDDDLKRKLQKDLDTAGISMNTYFVMAAKQLVLQKRIPFEIITEPEIPNKTTEKAMLLADAKNEGLVSDDSPSFTNVDDLMKSLDKD
ncbi:type II toxin-antitoxin system RelB/DinJ family antitoxin [Lactobacillus kefiranofaciens]|uniref:DNA-damage-inducible protein J n=1 Tax=Lactobacillus kefiranofaciens TaxID=267818 RepID=A0ABY0MIE8_9LACO|nr:type II toxin-antitoxin system RelB/DinJ family antitoxin [Lactobacillus kefiranofaciens]KRM19997.1 DNA-damage-inducible protein J [Lactobacillus kefiranofaciens subsp. kefiranofaciens DSM 5016 = JCM 6985]QFQ68441.1 type II toxin-antitoxin system RelB/DinJ family antitoxin [Lactobacillus kefiranofaciens subsp. kefiranofaciens]SDA72164.1 DNA-damage-inducible protein J [Lactobacillus kefiranofaciens]